MNRSLIRLLKIVLLIAALGLVLLASGALGAKRAQTSKQPTATGTGGAVSSVDHDAVDAAVAAALGVTEPYSCGIGDSAFYSGASARAIVDTVRNPPA